MKSALRAGGSFGPAPVCQGSGGGWQEGPAAGGHQVRAGPGFPGPDTASGRDPHPRFQQVSSTIGLAAFFGCGIQPRALPVSWWGLCCDLEQRGPGRHKYRGCCNPLAQEHGQVSAPAVHGLRRVQRTGLAWHTLTELQLHVVCGLVTLVYRPSGRQWLCKLV